MGRVIHFEIHAEDPERAIKFYGDVFGWQTRKWEGPVDYWLVTTGPESETGIDGAIIRRMGSEHQPDDQGPSAFVNTVQVESIEETERAVPAAGGELVVPRQEFPGVGKVTYFKDTEGNLFGALEAPESS